MDIKNLCGNCKHFNRHYVIRKERLKKTGFGHCVCKAKLHIYTDNKHCDKWEQADGTTLNKDIKEALKDMAKQLTDILLILNCD